MPSGSTESSKDDVARFWSAASCGEDLYLSERSGAGYSAQAHERYRLEPYIATFADFQRWRDKRVLEIGVGLGADHQSFAEAGAVLAGIDLTQRAVEHTRARFELLGLRSDVRQGDAEYLPFGSETFDLVYSWGVIHHSPNTARAAAEILRVLRPGGEFRVMIYHRYSLVGWMLWLRYALGRMRPWISLDQIYSTYLESPGTMAYTVDEACELFKGAGEVSARVVLTHGDLLESAAGQRHGGLVLDIARRFWPRPFLRRYAQRCGLFLLVSGRKSAGRANDSIQSVMHATARRV
jgi:SAM-dependent methyltransferase